MRGLAGFRQGYFPVDPASGRGMSITLGESEQARAASAAGVNPLRAQLAQALEASAEPTVQTDEVVSEG